MCHTGYNVPTMLIFHFLHFKSCFCHVSTIKVFYIQWFAVENMNYWFNFVVIFASYCVTTQLAVFSKTVIVFFVILQLLFLFPLLCLFPFFQTPFFSVETSPSDLKLEQPLTVNGNNKIKLHPQKKREKKKSHDSKLLWLEREEEEVEGGIEPWRGSAQFRNLSWAALFWEKVGSGGTGGTGEGDNSFHLPV